MKKISKNGVVHEYKSWAEAVELNGGGKTPRNATACKKYLEKQGFDLSTIEETDEPKTRSTSTNKTSIIEKLIKECQEVDQNEVKRLTLKLQNLIDDMTPTGETVIEMVKTRDALALAKNPIVTLDSILALVTKMYNEHMDEKNKKPAQTQDEENKKPAQTQDEENKKPAQTQDEPSEETAPSQEKPKTQKTTKTPKTAKTV